MEASVPYQYRRLQPGEIRIVDVLPSLLQKDVLHCKFRHVPLTSRPVFEALSYAWGDPQDTVKLLCLDAGIEQSRNDKKRSEATLTITKTLYEALHSHRKRASQVSMWADQICIDQSNILERNEQVKLMSTIYARATSTCIWLGPAQESDKFTQKLLLELLAKDKPEKSSDSIEQITFPKLQDGGWEALEKFFNRPWFSRTWVLPETMLAAKCNFTFGQHTWTFKSMASVITAVTVFQLESPFTKPPAALSWLRAMLSIRKCRSGDLTLNTKILDLVSFGRVQNAADDRDKIFAFLGLSHNEADQEQLVPDYSLDTNDVYTRFAIHCLSNHGDPQFLSHTCPTERSLPSWVPDWSVKLERSSRVPAWHFTAATLQKPKWKLSSDRMQLTLGGYFVGGLKNISPVVESMADLSVEQKFEALRTSVNAVQQVAEDAPDPYPNGQSRAEAFTRAIACDTTILGKRVTDQDLKLFELLIVASKQDLQTKMANISRTQREAFASFESSSLQNIQGRRFCLLDDGQYFGWVPAETDLEKGDFVVLFPGSTEFTILRPVLINEEGGEVNREMQKHYRVVGMAYLQGLMHGEYLQRPNLQTQDFCLV